MTGNRIGNKLAGMPQRQKVMAVITIIILLGVIWMVIDMFKTPKVVSVPPPQQMTRPMNAVSAQPGTAGAPPAGAPMGTPAQGQLPPGSTQPGQLAQTSQLIQANVLNIGKDSDLMKQQEQTQKDYLNKLNELQLLKVQREISETNQAISAARLATVTADKNMTDLLTKPAAPEVPVSAYAGSLAGPIKTGMPVASTPPTNAPPAVIAPTYVVISVSMQLNRWSAIVGAGGKLYNVSVGDVLPPDGSVVLSISSRGVVLEKDGKKQIVNIVSSI